MSSTATTCNVEHMGLPVPHRTYECCDRCNYADHRCPCCGDDLPHGVALCDEARAENGRSEGDCEFEHPHPSHPCGRRV